jgi:putative DNA primase/helicase
MSDIKEQQNMAPSSVEVQPVPEDSQIISNEVFMIRNTDAELESESLSDLPDAEDMINGYIPDDHIIVETSDGICELQHDPEGAKAMLEAEEAHYSALMQGTERRGDIATEDKQTADCQDKVIVHKNITISSELGHAEFVLKQTGVHWLLKSKDETEEVRLCRPLRIVAEARDERGENWCRVLEFEDKDEATHRYILRASDLAGDGREILAVLFRLGLAISPAKASKAMLLHYIADACPLNSRRFRITERTGWHGRQYIFPDGTIGQSDEEYIFESASSLIQTYSQRGTLESWRENVSGLCRGNSRLTFAVMAAFASALLAMTNDENGGFHFYGSSSTGKTHTLYVAASVCGRPTIKDKNSYIHSWRGTGNGIEGIAKLHSDSPLILDELGEVSPRDAGETAYMLGNGVGKQRANQQGEARHRSNWRCLFLSTGEITLSQHMLEGGKKARAGQEIRLIDIPADPGAGHGVYENIHGHDDGRVFSEVLKDRTLHNYGTAFPAFIQSVITDSETLPSILKKMKDDFIAENIPEGATSQVHRVVTRFALVAAAGEYATEKGITGWRNGEAWEAACICFRDWLGNRDSGSGMQEDSAILRQVRRFFELHGQSRFTLKVSDKKEQEDILSRSTINRAGFKSLTADGKYVYVVLHEVFSEEVCKGFDSRYVAKLLVKQGILQGGTDGRPSRVLTLPGMGQVRCYLFTQSVSEDVEA